MLDNNYQWAKRRRFMYVVSAFLMIVVGYALIRDLESAVAEAAVTMSIIGLLGIVGSYVFGAAWQDVSHMKFSAIAQQPPKKTELPPVKPGE